MIEDWKRGEEGYKNKSIGGGDSKVNAYFRL